MKPHKHAELIKAWADGAEIEWVYATQGDGTKLWAAIPHPAWYESHEYRIKPEPKPDVEWMGMSQEFLDWNRSLDNPMVEIAKECAVFNKALEIIKKYEYRIKPEPKPDVVLYGYAEKSKCEWYATKMGRHQSGDNLKLTFDGETGELKSAEVLK